MIQSNSDFGLASLIFNPFLRPIALGWYSEGPGVSLDRNIIKSTSDFGFASLIMTALFLRTYFGLYWPGPGVSFDRFIIQSVSVLGFAVENFPPPGLDHLPEAEQTMGPAVLGRRALAVRLASRSRKDESEARLGLFLVTGDSVLDLRGVVRRLRGVERRLRGFAEPSLILLSTNGASWGALFVFWVALAIILAACLVLRLDIAMVVYCGLWFVPTQATWREKLPCF